MSIKDVTERVAQPNVYVDTVVSPVLTVVIPAGLTVRGDTIFNSEFERLEILNVAMKVRVDTDDENHVFDSGPSLTADQALGYPYVYDNDGYLNDTPLGRRVFGYYFRNLGSNSHTYYIRFKFYKMRQDATAT